MRLIVFCLAIAFATVACISPATARAGRHGSRSAGQFDYWLMALSWSPSYCALHPDDARQCRRHKGYGFVMHGLWPQQRNGWGPQDCDSHDSPDPSTVQRALSFMPSQHLIEHEWRAHGSCSGLSASDYFATADRAFAAIRIPAELQTPRQPPALSANALVAAFVRDNPKLSSARMSVVCRNGGELVEVRVCLDRGDLSPRDCGGRVRNTCRAGALQIRAAR